MRKFVIAVAILAIIGLAGFWVLTMPREAVSATQAASLEKGADAKRGEAVFYAGGCASCHATPNQKDKLHLGGGLAMHSPFGTFYAPNISPHKSDGIGSWTLAQFANALKAGVAPDGSHYYPAFPYTSYAKMTNEDVRDLFAFMKTLKPVSGRAKPHAMQFPFNIRRGLGLWKLMFVDASPIEKDPGKSEEWNRGRYLVEALGHCAECHSKRNFMGGIEAQYRYAGGPDPEGKGWVPNMTPHKDGIPGYSIADIAELLKSGMTPELDSVGASMGAVIENMSKLSDADRKAMATYIKSLPARPSPPRPARK